MTIRPPLDQFAPVEKLLHLANQAHQDKLYALAGYFTAMCFKVGTHSITLKNKTHSPQ